MYFRFGENTAAGKNRGRVKIIMRDGETAGYCYGGSCELKFTIKENTNKAVL